LKRFFEASFPRLVVPSFQELPASTEIENAGIVPIPMNYVRTEVAAPSEPPCSQAGFTTKHTEAQSSIREVTVLNVAADVNPLVRSRGLDGIFRDGEIGKMLGRRVQRHVRKSLRHWR